MDIWIDRIQGIVSTLMILLILGLIVLLFWGYTPPKLQEDPYPPTQIEGKLGDDVIIIDGERFELDEELLNEE